MLKKKGITLFFHRRSTRCNVCKCIGKESAWKARTDNSKS